MTSHHITTHHKMSRNVTKVVFNPMGPPHDGTHSLYLGGIQERTKTPQLGANKAPRSPILVPRSPQDPPSWSQDGPKTPTLQPRWPKVLPRPLNLEPRCLPRAPTATQNAYQDPATSSQRPINFDKISSPPGSKLGESIGKVHSSELGRVNEGAGGRGRSP